MENALVPSIVVYITGAAVVLILVLMENALVHKLNSNIFVVDCSLNPCFNGKCTRTR